MAIPVQRFEPMTWQQANPYTAGMAESANLVKQLQQNRFLAPQLRAQLEEQLLKNKITGVQAEYAPQTTQSDIMLKQGQAEQALANAEWMPVTAQAKFMEGLGRMYMGGYYNSPAVRLQRMLSMMPEGDRAAWIAKNGGTVENILDTYAQGVAYGGVMPNVSMPSPRSLRFNITNPQTGQQVYEPGDRPIANAIPMGSIPQQQAPVRQQLKQKVVNNIPTNLPPQALQNAPATQLAPAPVVTPGIANAAGGRGFNPVQNAFNATANNAIISKDIVKNFNFAQAAENYINSDAATKAFDTLSLYGGLAGKGKQELQKYLNADQYADYLSAKEQFMTGVAGAIGQLEGFGKTDQALNQGLNFFKLAQANLQGEKPNIAAALKFFQDGKDILNAKYNSLYQATHPLFDTQDRNPVQQVNLQEQLQNKTPQGQVTVEIGGKQYRAPADKLDELTKKYGAKVVG